MSSRHAVQILFMAPRYGPAMGEMVQLSKRAETTDATMVGAPPGDSPRPSIFVIGFPKAATTTLHRRIVAAGAVGATVKEPSVLLLDGPRLGDIARAYERYYPEALAGPAIDASPYYVYDARAIERIATLGSADHVLISVREPWARLTSQYLDQFLQGHEHRPLEQAIREELDEGIEVTDRSSRRLARRYLSSTAYGPYVDRVLGGELAARTRLLAAERLDHDQTREELSRWLRLPVPATTSRANATGHRASAAPALVYGAAERVGRFVPAWAHRRIAPAAKPVMARLAALPLPRGRRPDTTVDATVRAAALDRIDGSLDVLRSLEARRWIGARPDWLDR
jgi:hypothetical protein